MKSLFHKTPVALLALAICLALHSVAVAQSMTEPVEDRSGIGKWAMAYAFVALCIILGLFNVCRRGKRKGDTASPT